MTEQKDRFGLKKMTTNQEIAASFALVILGVILVLSALYPLSQYFNVAPAFLGLVMIVTGYFFSIEAVRELEEKDHFLSSKLMQRKKEDE